MKLARILTKAILYFYYLLRYRNHAVAYTFSHFHFPLRSSANVVASGNALKFIKTGNKITKAAAKIYINEWYKLETCLNDKRVSVISSSPSGIQIKVDGLTMNLLSASNVVTLYELFFEKIYAINIPYDETVVVADIGMNVGFGALFFSQYSFVSRIYSYEPFLSTYNEGLQNFELNPGYAHKIIPHHTGISDKNATLNVPLMGSGDGGASINEDILKINNTSHLPTTTINTIHFETEMRRIISENGGRKIVVKMDCEGEEYPIFRSVKDQDIFEHFYMMIIEWHLKSPDEILEVLTKNNFKILSLQKADQTSGMIYAFR